MKKQIYLIFSIILVALVIFSSYTLIVFAEDQKPSSVNITEEGGRIFISGTTSTVKNGVDVSLRILYPGVDANNITPKNIGTSIAYANQCTMYNSNKFDFVYTPKSGVYGECAVIINFSDSTDAIETSFEVYKDITAEIILDTFGNLNFDYTDIPVKVKVSSTPGTVTDLIVDFKVKTKDDNIVYADSQKYSSDMSGTTECTYSIDLSSSNLKYGTFDLYVDVLESESNRKCSANTRFSVANTADTLNNKMGICTHFDSNFTGSDMEDLLGIFSEAGYGLNRQEIRWQWFEKNKDSFELPEIEEEYKTIVSQNGMDRLVILAYGNPLYKYIDKDGNIVNNPMLEQYEENGEIVTNTDSQLYLDRFGRYCYEAALASKDYAQYYEVWNEYNMDGSHFNIDRGTPSDYVNLLKQAYENVHNANENAVVYGVSAAYVTSGYAYTTYEWIDEVFKAGGGEYMDALSFHIYTSGQSPEDSDKKAIVQNIKNIMAKYGYGDMKVILSETGYASQEKYNTYTCGEETYEKPEELRQAVYELRDYAMLYNSVDKLVFYNDVEVQNLNEYEHTLGHVHMNETFYKPGTNNSEILYEVEIPYEPKPVFLAISNWNALLSGSVLKEEKFSNGVYDYLFVTPNGEKIHMIWTEDEAISREFDLGCSNITLYDMYGNNKHIHSENEIFNLNLSGKPVYVKESGLMNVLFTDTDGKEITAFSGNQNIKINVEIDKKDLSEKNVCLAVASYCGDRLVECFIEKLSADDTYYKELNTGSCDKINIMAFNSIEQLKPLCVKRQINKKR